MVKPLNPLKTGNLSWRPHPVAGRGPHGAEVWTNAVLVNPKNQTDPPT